ncbi:hypothetical protein MPSI1_000899 [Malassezia psittaci]|uniref:GATA-type domain-containing protein n=1 Tax=Malassezia psittaci TaxID=1821823 RepID=A0AAF0F3Z8_9BASI|nr:hypothetical protein MPSI1_000899 [Malassezia psittaci]
MTVSSNSTPPRAAPDSGVPVRSESERGAKYTTTEHNSEESCHSVDSERVHTEHSRNDSSNRQDGSSSAAGGAAGMLPIKTESNSQNQHPLGTSTQPLMGSTPGSGAGLARPYVPGIARPSFLSTSQTHVPHPSLYRQSTTTPRPYVRPGVPTAPITSVKASGQPDVSAAPNATNARVAAPPNPAENNRKPKPSSSASRAKSAALTALTGGIIGLPSHDNPPPGFLTAGGGSRKVIPELVVPFPLPAKEPAPGEESKPREKSIALLQALRQSRMMHMMQVLPPFSYRQRSGAEYFDVVPRNLVQGIDPHKPHILLPLGHADVRVGPMIYYGVRFSELRASAAPSQPRQYMPPRPAPTNGLVQYPASVRPPPGEAGYIKSTQGYIRPSTTLPAARHVAVGAPQSNGVTVARSLAKDSADRVTQTSSPVQSSWRSAVDQNRSSTSVSTSEPAQSSSPNPIPNQNSTRNPVMEQKPAPPNTASTPESTDRASVTSSKPSVETKHASAASRGTSPPQLASNSSTPTNYTQNAQAPPRHSQAAETTRSSVPTSTPAATTSAQQTARPPPRPLDAGFLARLQQRAEQDKHLQNLLQLARSGNLPEPALPQLNAIIASLMVPPPAQPEQAGPPVIVVEFPENPSINFVLPLWHCAVERRCSAGARRGHSALLSFFLPAIGSKAASNSGSKEAKQAVSGMLIDASLLHQEEPGETARSTPTVSEEAVMAASSTETASTQEKPKESAETKRANRSKGSGSKKSAPSSAPNRNHEIFPATWFLRADSGIDERLWNCLSRVPGCVTTEPGQDPFFLHESDRKRFDTLQKSFSARYKTMPKIQSLPRQIAESLIPQGLEEHVVDRYAMRIQSNASRPQPKRKVATLSHGREGKAGRSEYDPSRNSSTHTTTGEPRSKRKRHIATHNPDGTIKSCGACGKTKTPMWRRGPLGPSQLCNACGAKWKAGRLVVPDVPPPPVFEDAPSTEAAQKTAQV